MAKGNPFSLSQADISNMLKSLNTIAQGLKTISPSNNNSSGGGGGNVNVGSVLSQAVGGIQALASSVRSVFTALNAGVSAFQSSVASLVKMANPAAFQFFTRALEDMQAVVGQMLTPILLNATKFIREFADQLINLSVPAKTALAAFIALGVALVAAAAAAVLVGTVINLFTAGLPAIIGAVVGGLAGITAGVAMFTDLGDKFKPLMDSLGEALNVGLIALAMAMDPIVSMIQSLLPLFGPLFQIMATIQMAIWKLLILPFEGMAAVLKVLEPLIVKAAEYLQYLADGLLSILGIEKIDHKKSSVGAAVRTAQIGDLTSFINAQTTRSFQGATPPEDAAAKLTTTNSLLTGIDKTLSMIWGKIEKYGAAASEAVSTVGKAISDPIGTISGAISDGIDSTRRGLDKLVRDGEAPSWLTPPWGRKK